ncbi:hypothetical protein [Paracoccus sp. ME4]|uniref:hypothetical protein n=1 Tax=Paracoccus sp. ME4 TaxID=3138066 RepID=UPI00398AB9D6
MLPHADEIGCEFRIKQEAAVTNSANGKMKSVNVKMTDEMIRAVDALNANRSKVVRLICAAILKTFDEGQRGPMEQAVNAAQSSSMRAQRMTRADGPAWRKAIVWIPEDMHLRLIREMDAFDIRPADFIRGAIIGYTGINPSPAIDGEDASRIWESETVETERAGS